MASPFATASRAAERRLESRDRFVATLLSGTPRQREEGHGDRWHDLVTHAAPAAERESRAGEALGEQTQRSSKFASRSSAVDSADEMLWVGARKTWRKVDRVVVDGGEHELAQVLPLRPA